MKKSKEQEVVKLTLTLKKDFYDLIQQKAEDEFLKVATYIRRLLKQNLLDKNNSDLKSLTQNENE
ncbi:hypothetical protein [Maribellus maritimus]|uniref:hypothetical protein n=1 Tax=Maribellus maritimus TaxID=2870838 RepID=UPI001EEBA05C|nr:hypothetical protein [Maribellus maritimus]MCG6189117.1 hypothetical protein [Maribellus maritimus]